MGNGPSQLSLQAGDRDRGQGRLRGNQPFSGPTGGSHVLG
jgi:hypothetical protein